MFLICIYTCRLRKAQLKSYLTSPSYYGRKLLTTRSAEKLFLPNVVCARVRVRVRVYWFPLLLIYPFPVKRGAWWAAWAHRKTETEGILGIKLLLLFYQKKKKNNHAIILTTTRLIRVYVAEKFPCIKTSASVSFASHFSLSFFPFFYLLIFLREIERSLEDSQAQQR